MVLSEDLRARIKEEAIMELSRGKESAIQVQTLLQKPAQDGGVASLDQLMLQISRSFANAISVLRSCCAESSAQAVADDGGKIKAAVGRSRRGCYCRRRTSDSWTKLKATMEDGHAWRKYGQKIILHFDHPRCYFRCTHKYEGCKATKQVQIIRQNPTLYQTTYFHHHTCKDSLAFLSAQVDSDLVDRNLISLQENITPLKDHSPNLTPLKDHSPNPIDVSSPHSEYFTANSSSDPWEDIFDLDSVGYKPDWGTSSGLYGEEVVSGFQSFDMEFDQLGEMDSCHFDES